jgi:hypothetical protein
MSGCYAVLRRAFAAVHYSNLIEGNELLRGRGPSTRYVLLSATQTGQPVRAGRPRRWTDGLIERELRAYLDGRADWPRPS